VPSGALANSKATVLDLGSNRITQIANDAFGYTFLLRKLVLADNMLDIISTNLSAAIPSAEVMVGGNAIWALPMNNAKIPSNSSLAAGRNTIQCVQYGPTLQGCACPPAMRYGVSTTSTFILGEGTQVPPHSISRVGSHGRRVTCLVPLETMAS